MLMVGVFGGYLSTQMLQEKINLDKSNQILFKVGNVHLKEKKN